MIKEIVLDTRELEAPEPIMKAMEMLSHLNQFSYMKMIHRMEPKLLLSHLTKKGFEYKVIQDDDFYIYIWHSSFDPTNIIGI